MQIVDFQQQNKIGLNLHFRNWQVEWPRAVVCLVHGLGEHIGRYDHVAKYLASRNIATIGFDHQGHGRTDGKRGHTNGLESMLDDVDLLLKTSDEKYPSLPVFLYGHSMGGNVVLNYALRRKTKINGLIATAPWIKLPKPPSAFLVLFGKIMDKISPSLTQANGLDTNELSNDPKVIETYLKDPLVHNKISVRAGTSLLQGAEYLAQFKGKVSVPMLLMHGTADKITSPDGSAIFAKQASGEVTRKEWQGLKHEIHNEPQQNEVLAFLVEWMERLI
ncbi:MAG: alpha/beta fold hydrolase [Bacteroidetes bacterium]|nr:alpha/beta fold hydrolase [Bacteroidota bacterium]